MTNIKYPTSTDTTKKLVEALQTARDAFPENSALARQMQAALRLIKDEQKEQSKLSSYRVAAKSMFFVNDGECEVDDNAIVSDGEEPGAYVAAWIWVPDSELGDTEANS
jgi:hypothetical protein